MGRKPGPPKSQEELREQRKKYFSKWYAEHKDLLSLKRKVKYKTDPNYRQEVLSGATQRYAKRKQVKVATALASPPPVVQDDGLLPKIVVLDGQELILRSKHALEQTLQISGLTLINWFKEGLLPEPTFVDDAQRRWFSQDYLAMAAKCAPFRTMSKEMLKQKLFAEHERLKLVLKRSRV